jgi:hypothetical protein
VFCPNPAESGDLCSLSMAFSFVGRAVKCAHELHWIIFSRGQVVCGTHLLELQIHTSRVGVQAGGE